MYCKVCITIEDRMCKNICKNAIKLECSKMKLNPVQIETMFRTVCDEHGGKKDTENPDTVVMIDITAFDDNKRNRSFSHISYAFDSDYDELFEMVKDFKMMIDTNYLGE